VDTGSREENASKQKNRASVLIQSEPKEALEKTGSQVFRIKPEAYPAAITGFVSGFDFKGVFFRILGYAAAFSGLCAPPATAF
jgi:hypothetical protein